MSNFWHGRRVLVTGGAGFVGRPLVERLRELGAREVIVPRTRDYDLREQAEVRRLLTETRPDLAIHLAATGGGIEANRARPGTFFYDNAIMGVMVIEEARRAGVEKLVIAGTICSYPKITPVPFREETLWDGYPEETNAPYGLAKKMLLIQAQANREQFGTNAIYLMPANLYGPRDNFDPETSHVIPALIRKFTEAKDSGADQVVLWGTATVTRDFLYVEDAVEGILLAAESYNGAEPVNLGTGVEISIRDLASMIAETAGYDGEMVLDPTKPPGQPRRVLDTSRALREFGFRAQTDIRKGLHQTLVWFRQNLATPASRG